MAVQSKGSDFERTICKKLSTWWTKDLAGDPRDDVFWRSSQSGGRATQRAKSGKTTFGSYGDIAAVDPIGAPLIKLFTIELKRGNYGYPADLLESSPSTALRPFEACLCQAIRSHEQAGSVSWLLICRRDHKQEMVYLPMSAAKLFEIPSTFMTNHIRYNLVINQLDSTATRRVRLFSMRLDDFLKAVTPKQIIQAINDL